MGGISEAKTFKIILRHYLPFTPLFFYEHTVEISRGYMRWGDVITLMANKKANKKVCICIYMFKSFFTSISNTIISIGITQINKNSLRSSIFFKRERSPEIKNFENCCPRKIIKDKTLGVLFVYVSPSPWVKRSLQENYFQALRMP